MAAVRVGALIAVLEVDLEGGVGVLKENLHKLDRGWHPNGTAASSKPPSWPLYLLAQIAL